MKRIVYSTAGLIAILLALGSFSVTSSGAKARTAASTTVITIRHTTLGSTLVDGRGHTLYLFEGDRANASKLSQAGLAVWPAFNATGKLVATGGVKAAKLGTIVTHGHRQVTYNHRPLYYFVGDQKAGDTKGQGLTEFGALWYVLSPAGAAVKAAPQTSISSSSTSSTSSGWGY